MKLLNLERPLIMAHRGDSARVPENTLLSLESAAQIGVDFIETDVCLTKDDELVLFHDENLERITGMPDAIRSKTLEELKEIDLGQSFSPDGESFPYRNKGLTVVTLREAFEKFKDIPFNLDIKDKDSHAPSLLASVIREYDREDHVIVGSFHDHQVYHFRKLMPDVKTSACPGEVTRFVLALKMRVIRLYKRKCVFDAFQVPMRYGRIRVIDERFIRAAHDRNIAVHVWTVNDHQTMEYLLDLGVDGIFTDSPALLRDVLSKRGLL